MTSSSARASQPIEQLTQIPAQPGDLSLAAGETHRAVSQLPPHGVYAGMPSEEIPVCSEVLPAVQDYHRRRRSLALLKTLSISSLQAGRGSESSMSDCSKCQQIAALSPRDPVADVAVRHHGAEYPCQALQVVEAAQAAHRTDLAPTAPERRGSGATDIIGAPYAVSEGGSSANSLSQYSVGHSSDQNVQDWESVLRAESPGPDQRRQWVATQFGALGASVVRESAATKAKKNAAVDGCRDAVRESRVRAVPLDQVPAVYQPNVKVVHFLRHGEGTSNSAARINGRDQYRSSQWKDARLTNQGREQALEVAAFVRRSPIKLELLVVSPLRRAAVTGCIAFHSLLHSQPAVPILALELLRERSHGNPCDLRSSRPELEQECPAVDYSLCAAEDPFRDRVGENGENWADTAERSREFLRWLSRRSEQHIGVATHSAFLLVLFRLVVDCTPELREWFETGELRSVALIFPEAGDI
eukprot:TRINITY_DN19029_c0_g2_i2.p1 TRINITY_DN19029_c0_g2~~TRINITY_DN19029_c0_g2_i2.p1  ORF type:complete len:504 (+),score=109.36 TRINITY_DN19029_c0_g2_i2:97-1512(+)